MTVIRLDAATLAQFKAATGEIVLADASGAPVYRLPGAPVPTAEPQLSDEEWRQRMDPTNGKTTAEVLAFLKTLGTP